MESQSGIPLPALLPAFGYFAMQNFAVLSHHFIGHCNPLRLAPEPEVTRNFTILVPLNVCGIHVKAVPPTAATCC